MKKITLCLLLGCLLTLTCLLPAQAKEEAEQPVITSQPNGITLELGTASFYMSVQATVNTGTLSYQWYTTTADGSSLHAISGATNAIYVPEQIIGTYYYCVTVTNTTESGETAETTSDIAVVTFRNKTVYFADIRDITAPVSGEKPVESASRYTDNNETAYYGYDIESIRWEPADEKFLPDTAYTVWVTIGFWDDAEPASNYYGMINGKNAVGSYGGGDTFSFSYTFEKTAAEKVVPKPDEEKIPAPDSEDTTEDPVQNNNNSSFPWMIVILIVIIIAAIVVIIIVLMRDRKHRDK